MEAIMLRHATIGDEEALIICSFASETPIEEYKKQFEEEFGVDISRDVPIETAVSFGRWILLKPEVIKLDAVSVYSLSCSGSVFNL